MINLGNIESEGRVIGTLIDCLEQLDKGNMLPRKNAMIYRHNFGSLKPMFEDSSFEPGITMSSRNNRYVYFKGVYNFLGNNNLDVQSSLNECLNVDHRRVENPVQFNVITFKNDLRKAIMFLEKQDDTSFTPELVKMRILANRPVMVLGFNISTNLGLLKELKETFNIEPSKLISVCYDRGEKQLIFVPEGLNTMMVCYDLKKDMMDNYQVVNNIKLKTTELKPRNYLSYLRENISFNIMEVHKNMDMLELTFTDNLYLDNFMHRLKKDNSVVKY
jgi:hypothetical protein